MTLYIILYILVFGLAILSFRLTTEVNKITFWITSFIIVVFASLRYESGLDWNYYQMQFDKANIDYIWGNLDVEPLFVLLCIFIKSIGGTFFIVSMIITGISTILTIRFLSKYSSSPIISLFFALSFIVTFDMGLIRQALAIAILLYSLKYVEKRKLVPFLILLLISMGFHFSAVIFLPVYFVGTKRLPILLSISAIGIAFLFDVFFRFSIPVDSNPFIWEHIQHKYLAYYDSQSHYAFQINSFYWRGAVWGGVTYLLKKEYNEKLNFLNNIYFLGFIFFIVFAPVYALSTRGSFYFKIVEVVLIVNVGFQYKYLLKKWGALLVLLIGFLYFSRGYYHRTHALYERNNPYKNIIHKYL